jgi:O-acetyl-ADP-ribose deacetylase (regulator of RNase III)
MRDNELMPAIFINYRAQRQAGHAALLDRELCRRFGADAVFCAPRSIPLGEDFSAEISRNLRMCAVLLAVIGPGWLSFGADDPSRLPGAVDWVRQEIADALAHQLRVIPVLVQDACMPDQGQLPADITALARCQAVHLHDHSVDAGLARIIKEIGDLVPEPGQIRLPDEETEPGVRLFEFAGAPASRPRIGVVAGSIRRVRFADIWVNSENTDMEMSRFSEFSISAILRYYGAQRDSTGRVINDVIAGELAERAGSQRPIAPGAAIVTGSGSLAQSHKVRYIIHVAAVQGEPGAGFRQVRNIDDCVTNALTIAEQLARKDPTARTVLIPLLGAGVAGAPIAPTAHALLGAAIDHIEARPDHRLTEIYFLGYTKRERAAINEAIHARSELTPGKRMTIQD